MTKTPQDREKRRLEKMIQLGESCKDALGERIKKERNPKERERLQKLLDGVLARLTADEGKLDDIEFEERYGRKAEETG